MSKSEPSAQVAETLVAALSALGVRHAVLCPGSRSAPLAYALARAEQAGRLRLQVRLDERTAGFVALGTALATGEPAVVVTTSGTAVANLHPAVLEADAAGVPLIVLSADRPHELRGLGANQVTDQVKLFGAAVRWFGELPAPDTVTDGLRKAVRQQVSRAVAAARGLPGGNPGPVQLNVAFREPLVAGGRVAADDGTAGLTRVEATSEPTKVRLEPGPRTVVLAGHGAGPEPLVVARAAGWPLLAEPSSGARMEDAVPAYRLLLDRPELGGRVERVLLYGRPTLSRPVTRLLSRDDVEVIVVSTRPDWADPGGRAARVVGAVDPPLGGTGPAAQVEADGDWIDAWLKAGSLAGQAIDAVLADEPGLTGPLVAREVLAATGPGDVLVAGSSNPVRDLDLFGALPGAVRWAAGKHVYVSGGARLLANRGLAGIDGTVSTALGAAAALEGTTVRALVGDLTVLHDAGALLRGALEPAVPVQVVVLDDGGGGIFSTLEQGALAESSKAENARFERLFATPQRMDLEQLCAAYRVTYTLARDLDDLRTALASPPTDGPGVVHVRVPREGRRALGERLAAAVQASFGAV